VVSYYNEIQICGERNGRKNTCDVNEKFKTAGKYNIKVLEEFKLKK
jgi:hypothetical protein